MTVLGFANIFLNKIWIVLSRKKTWKNILNRTKMLLSFVRSPRYVRARVLWLEMWHGNDYDKFHEQIRLSTKRSS